MKEGQHKRTRKKANWVMLFFVYRRTPFPFKTEEATERTLSSRERGSAVGIETPREKPRDQLCAI